MNRPLRRFAAVILLMAGLSSGLQAQSSPDEFIRTISQSVLDDLKADRSLQSGDIERLNALVERKVMPYVDFQRMTALAVGRNWRAATPEQQRALMQEFRRLLLLTYSGAVRQVNDLTLQVRPVRGKPDDDEIIVRTQVLRPGREPILIDYRMQKSGSGWKIFDLNIMGLWLVEHYRNQFAQVVSASGIDGLIQSLREKNQTLAMSGGSTR
ncbi:MAG: ABC transporter substrate-binding protein [Betaproteobacteria bacterium]|jgi:phospholipid transport system substrate-binding protein|nr:ABC transporter substrate-binding protein [Betaproteobacteria bacterium]